MNKMPFGGGKPRAAEPVKAPEAAPQPPPQRPQAPPQQVRSADAAPAMRTVLGQGCVVEGKLVCAGPTQLDGKITGELVADDFLMIDRNATIVADLNVQEVVVRGVVKGNISAARRVTLEETAQVEGDVAAPAFDMRPGAQMSGKIDVLHRPRETAAPAGPALRPFVAPTQPAYQATPIHRENVQPSPTTAPAAPAQSSAPPSQPREPAHTFVAFDDGTDRSGF